MSILTRIILVVFAILMTIVTVGAIRAEKKKAKYKVIVYVLIFAVFFTASSLFWTTDIAYDTETITHLEFGLPIPFAVQNLSFYNPPFPYPMGVDISGHSPRGVFMRENFIFSIIINFIFAIVIWRLVSLLISRRSNR